MQTGRLTNLSSLTVDTSWYNRYRSADNPDFGATFPQVVEITDCPTIPLTNATSNLDIQAIAHSAAFHFATIEQGGGSLYAALIDKVSSVDVLAILGSIGPVEVYHFAAFHKSLERIFPVRTAKVTFPNLAANRDVAQAIMPEPCEIIGINFPLCSVIRPRTTARAGAVATVTALVQQGLFAGQSQAFFDAATQLAINADAAVRTL